MAFNPTEFYEEAGFDPDRTPVDVLMGSSDHAIGTGLSAGFAMLYPEETE